MSRNIFNRQQWKLMQRGYSEEDARRIAYSQQKNTGNLIPGTFRLSEQGREYSKKESWERAIEREAKKSGRPVDDYYWQDGKVRVKPIKKNGFKKGKLD